MEQKYIRLVISLNVVLVILLFAFNAPSRIHEVMVSTSSALFIGFAPDGHLILAEAAAYLLDTVIAGVFLFTPLSLVSTYWFTALALVLFQKNIYPFPYANILFGIMCMLLAAYGVYLQYKKIKN